MATALRFHDGRTTGALGRVICRDGFLLKTNSVHPDLSKPCPACNKTERAQRVTARRLMDLMCPILPEAVERVLPKAAPIAVHRDEVSLDTTGFAVIRVPEGVRPRTNRDGKVIRKKGQVVMETVDFRSDAAVTNRMVRSGSKWGKGRVTGSTSTSSNWAVPARPGRDDMASSSDVLKDLRTAEMERDRERQKKTPRRGKHQPRKVHRVRLYGV